MPISEANLDLDPTQMKFEPVNESEWRFENISEDRIFRLTSPPDAEKLVQLVVDEVRRARFLGDVKFIWESHSEDAAHRAWIISEVNELVLDRFFNGRFGYRAQYYRDPLIGNAYNAYCVATLNKLLIGSLETADVECDVRDADGCSVTSTVPLDLFKRSLYGPESKVWLPIGSFEMKSEGTLDVQRWKRSGDLKGILLPMQGAIDIKGTFLSDRNGAYVGNKHLGARAIEIHERGNT